MPQCYSMTSQGFWVIIPMYAISMDNILKVLYMTPNFNPKP